MSAKRPRGVLEAGQPPPYVDSFVPWFKDQDKLLAAVISRAEDDPSYARSVVHAVAALARRNPRLRNELAEPVALDRKGRAELAAWVVTECGRDPAFAGLLVDNLAAAGVKLPRAHRRGHRPVDWTHAALVRLFAEFGALRLQGLGAEAARERIADAMGRGLSARHLTNVMSLARRRGEVTPEDFGPTLRDILFTKR